MFRKTFTIMPTLAVALAMILVLNTYPISSWAITSKHPATGKAISKNTEAPADLEYILPLATTVYYWGYPLVNMQGRTNQWKLASEPGILANAIPIAPANTSSCFAHFIPAPQRLVKKPNQDILYGSGLANLGKEPAVIQTPTKVPPEYYWNIEIVDAFGNSVFQLGSREKTSGGKYLLVGPDWNGKKTSEFKDILRMPTNLSTVTLRTVMLPTKEGRLVALGVLQQMRMYPLSENQAGPRKTDCRAIAHNIIYPPSSSKKAALDTTDYLATTVDPKIFWNQLDQAIQMNPSMTAMDNSMAVQARVLIDFYNTRPEYRELLDKVAIDTDATLRAKANYTALGTPIINGWYYQKNNPTWKTDWFKRAQATLVYGKMESPEEVVHLYRTTDNNKEALHGKKRYSITFSKDELPPVDEKHGGFWSISLYDGEDFIPNRALEGRTTIGSKNLAMKELQFYSDGSLTIYIGADVPGNPVAKANWLPAPADTPFTLLMRVYAPGEQVVAGNYKVPNVVSIQ